MEKQQSQDCICIEKWKSHGKKEWENYHYGQGQRHKRKGKELDYCRDAGKQNQVKQEVCTVTVEAAFGQPENPVDPERPDNPEMGKILVAYFSWSGTSERIVLCYPIWWGEAPHIVYSLVENVSLKKKTVIPFSTSISSGLGSSGKHLKARAKISSKTKWMKGRNFYDVPSQKTVNKWVKSMKY